METDTERPVAPVPVEPIAYATPSTTNAPATASLVWGLLLFLPFVSGLLAIVYARRGRRRAEELGGAGSGFARAGFALGVINLVLSVIGAVALVPLSIQARRQAQMVQCMSQLRQITVAAHMYANNNRGLIPPDIDTLNRSTAIKPVCTCPGAAAHGVPPAAVTPGVGNSSYVYVKPPGVTRLAQIRGAHLAVIAYEPAANHGGRGMNVAFWDGHVEWIPAGPAMQRMQAQIAAQEQAAKAAERAAKAMESAPYVVPPATRQPASPE